MAVSRLFYNAPARQKFLRGPRSEWRSIMETMTTIALNRRDVRLTLTHDGKNAFALPAAATLRDLGFSLATDMIGGFNGWANEGMPVERLPSE